MSSRSTPICWIICTMDTKRKEGLYLQNALKELGIDARIADVGTRSNFKGAAISSSQIAAAGDVRLSDLQNTSARMEALTAMAKGLKKELLKKFEKHELDAVVSLGGSGGTTLASEAMCALPVGIPKLMVSTVVSGDIRPYIRGKDIMALNPVADLAGLNVLTRQALRTAARTMYGQLAAPVSEDKSSGPAVAITSFGSTESCVGRCVSLLAEQGFESVSFHARGISGGDIMEELIREGRFQAVLDITTTEAADLFGGGVYPCSQHRFEAAVDMGLPFVIAPGAIDMINFTLAAATPERLENRTWVQHSGNTILARTNSEENRKIAAFIAQKLNRAKNTRYRVLLAQKGFSAYDAAGGAFFNPEADAAFIQELKCTMEHPENIVELPLHLNDAAFAQRAVAELMTLLSQHT